MANDNLRWRLQQRQRALNASNEVISSLRSAVVDEQERVSIAEEERDEALKEVRTCVSTYTTTRVSTYITTCVSTSLVSVHTSLQVNTSLCVVCVRYYFVAYMSNIIYY